MTEALLNPGKRYPGAEHNDRMQLNFGMMLHDGFVKGLPAMRGLIEAYFGDAGKEELARYEEALLRLGKAIEERKQFLSSS